MALRGEGAETKELDVPLYLTWSLGEAEVRSTRMVDFAVRIIGWAKQEAPVTMTFYILAGERETRSPSASRRCLSGMCSQTCAPSSPRIELWGSL